MIIGSEDGMGVGMGVDAEVDSICVCRFSK